MSTLEVCPGSFLDEELRATHADLLCIVRTKTGPAALVYVLFDHQSTNDATMALRYATATSPASPATLREDGAAIGKRNTMLLEYAVQVEIKLPDLLNRFLKANGEVSLLMRSDLPNLENDTNGL